MAIFENGFAPNVMSVANDTPNVPRSSFNMSRVTNFNGIIGALMPFDVLETLPNEDYTISYDIMAMTRNPMVKRFMNGMNIYVHTYWSANKDLWEGWRNFIDKGRDGKHTASIPKLYPAYHDGTAVNDAPLSDEKKEYDTRTVFAPSSYMGLPITYFDKSASNENYGYVPCPHSKLDGNSVEQVVKVNNCYSNASKTAKWGVSALPFMMYNKIYRDYYANPNLLMDNKNWYPENENDFILPYTITGTDGYCNNAKGTIVNIAKSTFTDGESSLYIPKHESTDLECMFNAMHFRQFKGDYFTSANPFEDLLRGDKSLLNIDLNANLDLSNLVTEFNDLDNSIAGWGDVIDTNGKYLRIAKYQNDVGYDYKLGMEASVGGATSDPQYLKKALEKLKMKYKSGGNVTVQGATLSQLRKACVLEKFMQRNAKTDGSYKELINAQFGYMPSDHDMKPTYIGGCKQSISFNEVKCTDSTALGEECSNGISANSGFIGKFHSDDYGYIMSVMMIVPDVYYNNQGLDTMWTRTEQDLQYYPLLNNLDPQAIKNKEIFISNDDSYNEDVFGYADIFEDMKHRRNIICGLGAVNEEVFDSANFMKRTFSNANKPQLCNEWLAMSPSNVDMTPFSSVNAVPFDLMVGCSIDKVSPMPYAPKPADMGIAY